MQAGEPLGSKYVGVRWSSKKGKWRVRIKANGKDNHVGFVSAMSRNDFGLQWSVFTSFGICTCLNCPVVYGAF